MVKANAELEKLYKLIEMTGLYRQSFALAESLCAGRSDFALIRPPVHHAGKAKAEGFYKKISLRFVRILPSTIFWWAWGMIPIKMILFP